MDNRHTCRLSMSNISGKCDGMAKLRVHDGESFIVRD